MKNIVFIILQIQSSGVGEGIDHFLHFLFLFLGFYLGNDVRLVENIQGVRNRPVPVSKGICKFHLPGGQIFVKFV